VQGRFGSQEVDAEELGESEEGGGALGEMVEGLLDDLLERVDASLDRARAQLKANPGATADVSNTVASVAAPPAASQVAGAQPCNMALQRASRILHAHSVRCKYSMHMCCSGAMSYGLV
jgi:hypothetical protein